MAMASSMAASQVARVSPYFCSGSSRQSDLATQNRQAAARESPSALCCATSPFKQPSLGLNTFGAQSYGHHLRYESALGTTFAAGKSREFLLRSDVQPGKVRAVGSAERTSVKSAKPDGPQEPLGLPPGQLGLPVLGETIDYLKSQNTDDPDSFIHERMGKYGSVFMSNLLGKNTIVITGPDAAEFIFSNEKNFVTEWPTSTRLLLGERSLSVVEGARHKYLRGLLSGPLNLENLKKFVPLVERVVLTELETWEDNSTMRVFDSLKQLTFNIISELIFGAKPGPQAQRLSKEFKAWLPGLFSLFAVRLPFTQFGASMDARDRIISETASILRERRAAMASGDPVPDDILLRIMTERDAEGSTLSDEDLQDNLLQLLFAGHDTSSAALSSILRYLAESPSVVDKLREEHAEVRRRKKAGEPLTWEDVRKMSYTEKVISEGLRVRPIVANNFKRAVDDISFKGYLIPAGHNVTLSYRSTMCSDDLFPEAAAFRPERFDEKPAPYTYLPFGAGKRQCPGVALARMEMTVFLYHFLDGWDWTLVNPKEAIAYFPLPQPVDGLPIKLRKRLVTA